MKIKIAVISIFLVLASACIGGCNRPGNTTTSQEIVSVDTAILRENLLSILQSMQVGINNQKMIAGTDFYKIGDYYITCKGNNLIAITHNGQEFILHEFEKEIVRFYFLDNDTLWVLPQYDKYFTYKLSANSIEYIEYQFPELYGQIEEINYHNDYVFYIITYAPYEAEAVGGVTCIYSQKKGDIEQPKKIVDNVWNDWRFTDFGVIYTSYHYHEEYESFALTAYICDYDGGNNRKLETPQINGDFLDYISGDNNYLISYNGDTLYFYDMENKQVKEQRFNEDFGDNYYASFVECKEYIFIYEKYSNRKLVRIDLINNEIKTVYEEFKVDWLSQYEDNLYYKQNNKIFKIDPETFEKSEYFDIG